MVLLSTLASDASPDLTDPKVVTDPVAVLNELAASDRIPDCSGWTFYAVGPSTADNPPLREFWRQYADRCGGQLVAWTSRLAGFPDDREPVAKADTRLIVENTGSTTVAPLDGDLSFDFAKATLRPDMASVLDDLLQLVVSTTGSIEIVGHTDERGSADANLALSIARAQSLKDWLVEHGVDAKRMTCRGVGAAEPVAPNATTEAQHAQNRRFRVRPRAQCSWRAPASYTAGAGQHSRTGHRRNPPSQGGPWGIITIGRSSTASKSPREGPGEHVGSTERQSHRCQVPGQDPCGDRTR